ncbi:hypothetical protein DXT91_19700 [Agrobacterium tumefaciens]|uniref:hypothetical protein n=1 Tax=Agrobacterium tumefaciens TaxID=358 RepID=UPI0012B77A33|nr:hypothetical protein [Agrobacterium tumefaciens]MQB06324.1 hypothetical protein [Agrobacterium tumefaciens]
MDPIEQNLVNWKESLFASIPVGGLLSRNSVVYKWKAAFRIWMLREAIFWRLSDLMTQSYALHKQGHGLGARILLRSGLETLATLIYLNQLMQDVLERKLDFHAFGEKTAVLLLGSRNNADMPYSLNIVTVLSKCDKRYPGIMALYADLSESSHPSYEGLCMGYSKIDHEEYEAHFSNRWMEIFGSRHLRPMELCMEIFQHEYNDVWSSLMEKLEDWIEANDAELEATKNSTEGA